MSVFFIGAVLLLLRPTESQAQWPWPEDFAGPEIAGEGKAFITGAEAGVLAGGPLCLDCHDGSAMDDREVWDPSLFGHLSRSVHAGMIPDVIALQEGRLACISCHVPHAGMPGTGEDARKPYLIQGNADGAFCANCHKGHETIVGSPHDFRHRKEGAYLPDKGRSAEFGVCGGCHASHGAPVDKGLLVFPVSPPQGRGYLEDMFCLHCHNDPGVQRDRRVKFYIHPPAEMVREEFRERVAKGRIQPSDLLGKADRTTEAGYEALFRVACITCHDNHQWSRASEQPSPALDHVEVKDFLKGREVAETVCANCHGGEALYLYRYFHREATFRLRIRNE